jgi:hypothetical protein
MFVQLNRDFVGRKAGERLDLSDTDANALIATGTASPLADDPLGPLFQASLDRALAGVAGQVQSSVESALQGFAQAQTKSRKNALPAIFGPGTAGDPKRTFGRFLLAVRHGDRKRSMTWVVGLLNGMSNKRQHYPPRVARPAATSFPLNFTANRWRLVSERSVVRPRGYRVADGHARNGGADARRDLRSLSG